MSHYQFHVNVTKDSPDTFIVIKNQASESAATNRLMELFAKHGVKPFYVKIITIEH